MSGQDEEPDNAEDAAPGEARPADSATNAKQVYLLGLLLAAGLTAASFWVAGSGFVWGPGVPAALIALAVAQIGVHLVFFLHITSGPENANNSLALAFGVLIVVLVIAGSIWIMGHLNHNMMPTNQMMQMQR